MTIAGVDRELCARLVAEAKEDDERMSAGLWSADAWGGLSHIRVDGESVGISSMGSRVDADAIARTRNNLPDIATQLEALLAENAKLREVAEAAGRLDRVVSRRQAFYARQKDTTELLSEEYDAAVGAHDRAVHEATYQLIGHSRSLRR